MQFPVVSFQFSVPTSAVTFLPVRFPQREPHEHLEIGPNTHKVVVGSFR